MIFYKDAGVDIDYLSLLKRAIKRKVEKTFSPFMLSSIGLFGSLFELRGYKKPVLVGSCDGVGTKLLVANMMNRHNTVGECLVNHCVNDILTLGAKPLFFLDYISFSSLAKKVIGEIMEGLVRGCQRNGLSLAGGEMAQLPGFYPKGIYDLAGFIVGVVEKEKIIDGQRITPGDLLIGLSSSGLHTNGYSLARKVFFEKKGFSPKARLGNLRLSLGEELLRVHRSYLREVYPILPYVKGMAHITGGGFSENIKRILPKRVSALIRKESWPVPEIFRLIQEYGEIEEREMFRVFNMGIGLVLFVKGDDFPKIKGRLKGCRVIGEAIKGEREVLIGVKRGRRC